MKRLKLEASAGLEEIFLCVEFSRKQEVCHHMPSPHSERTPTMYQRTQSWLLSCSNHTCTILARLAMRIEPHHSYYFNDHCIYPYIRLMPSRQAVLAFTFNLVLFAYFVTPAHFCDDTSQ
jgi:hypothetical protein